MGDWFQTIVDPEATEGEAAELADSVLRWLIEEQIVVSQRSNCTLGDAGYAPGTCYTKATGSPEEHFLSLWTNGLELVSKRSVFDNGGFGFDIVCASCGGRFEPPKGLWADAAGEWFDRSGPGLLACPGCRAVRAITEWRHDPPLGFANLGFTFWNWPAVTDAFVRAIGERLGHRVFVVAGKI